LLEGGFAGEVYLVNPKRDYVYGRPCYRSITHIEGRVDLVLVVVPPRFVVSAVSEAVEKGAKGAIIITAGLNNTDENGYDLNQEILRVAREGDMRIIGPNCSGLFNASASINLLGVPPLYNGGLSVVSQSGNIIDSLTHYARLKGMGFNKIISVGNAIDIDFYEYLEFLGDDPDTKVILMYMEGVKDGARLLETGRRISADKPIVAIKVGRSKAGSRAALSHTGSLTGDDHIVDAAFRQAGIIRVNSVDEMFDVARVLQGVPLPKGRGVAILSEGGGDSAVAADNVEELGLSVPTLSRKSMGKLGNYLMAGTGRSNPVDYGGTAEESPHKVIPPCCRICLEDGAIDTVFITGFFGGYKDIIGTYVEEHEIRTAKELVRLSEAFEKPIFVHTSFADQDIKAIKILKKKNIPVFESSIRVARCILALVERAEFQRRYRRNVRPKGPFLRNVAIERIINRLYEEKRYTMLETEGRLLLKKAGIDMLPSFLVKTGEEAIEAAGKLGFPVVLKIVSRDIQHKWDVGGVKLGLMNDSEVLRAFDEIIKNAREVTTAIEGVLVLPMVPVSGKVECLASVVRDSVFGPVLVFGLGGIFTEVLRDIAVRVLPVTKDQVKEMIREIKGYPVLKGVRGAKPRDIGALEKLLFTLSKIALNYPEIHEIELNPVIVHRKGVSVVDTLITLEEDQ